MLLRYHTSCCPSRTNETGRFALDLVVILGIALGISPEKQQERSITLLCFAYETPRFDLQLIDE
jgi:hypothetical protein